MILDYLKHGAVKAKPVALIVYVDNKCLFDLHFDNEFTDTAFGLLYIGSDTGFIKQRLHVG